MVDMKSRVIELDILRILAVFAVILLHVSANVVLSSPYRSLDFTIGNFFDSVSRFAVPFFVMISGYFMLNENKTFDLNKLLKKVLKLFVILVVWSAFYAVVYDFHNFRFAFLQGHFHLWYIYLVIGLYLLIPVLRLFVKIENRKFIYYLIILSLIFVFIPRFLDLIFAPKLISKFFKKFIIFQNIGYIAYFLIGWSFLNNIKSAKKYLPVFALVSSLSFLLIFMGASYIPQKYYPSYTIFYDNEALPVFVYSVSLFYTLYILVNKFINNFNDKIKNFICNCSSLTLGVYLVHVVFLQLYSNYFSVVLNKFLYIPICFFAITFSSFALTYILSKIKYVNKLIKL